MHMEGIDPNSLNVLPSKEKNSKEKPNKFDICLSAFKEKYGLTRNVQIDEEQNTFKCEKCNRIFLRESGLEGHMARHLDRTPFKCEVCNSAFRYKYKLKAHKRDSEICGKHSVTESPDSLQQKAKPHKYDICLLAYNEKYGVTGDGKIREEQNNFNREKRDLGQSPFTCVVCNSTYKHKRHLTAHMRIHDEHNPFKCVECHKNCQTKSDLARHMAAHTNYRPLKCDICSSAFKTKSTLRLHKKIHEKCKHCNIYHSKSDLKTQMTEHPEFVMTEDGNFECSVCYVTFNHICHLKWHMKKHEEDNK
ncbi:Zinc finger protein 43 like protein [Argiope bruennichi]|uniref:Zinc finger protein 43 like protein n=2 Tax=Argiope bruennichi TaxID=94029 RepID=A0A8T0EVT0_ARGBR|nr:Zinc finger protein 43 like protein [Argiope bruennichi]